MQVKSLAGPAAAATAQPAAPRLIPDKQMAPLIGVSVAYLQRDRREAQRIPFIRIGDRCLYEPDAVFAALKQYEVGGPRGRRGR